MTQEDKELLLKDLCARLQYGVHIWTDDKKHLKLWGIEQDDNGVYWINGVYGVDEVKPYLRPMSSITEEEKLMYEGLMIGTDNVSYMLDVIDWLNKRMFDFRGLIPKGLAEIAPEGIYELKLLDNYLPSQNESDSAIDNTTKITVGCKIRSKTNPNEILSIISDDCHGDEFECANGDVLSLKQIEKYYDLIK